ncbi:hypothetical protein [Methylomonas albis]|uniref:Uncharacterized protein n=1 Tax=Methylomonas albis TaxID=1854563 RepID=A0ABR9D6L3_9GAMM|nr:hypothetical protein [Methylomonas albis]MBD9358756.1 hypothetical protein [Methylomonas albis]CAD6882208.1 hypothetical protein [Methylomonas albis]
MNKVLIALTLMVACSSAMADRYGHAYYPGVRYGMVYDPVDAMANNQIAAINAQEQADVRHELDEGDFREAQRIMQRDEAIKYQIRQNEAMYDQARDWNRYRYGYGYYDDDD